ncbi:MAG TPA: hypothetical protein VJL09_01870 [Candidatus Paceibacterota bacterium]|uniref:PIN domain-containing protein n=1 Tax=Candidatus Doudnabacteria bacterium RIFCSPHIGHO2_01_52_17 TaxID=1817820 RepID=A0A1F5NFZ9_9BACT|nr:MAG: hypothetical protein A3K06_00645 [Candidatus Doudnabacteria bacterium RIFCSPHIGHO2_01_52_17]HLD62090.1 hypothetical protein [Patescibacteria group bacterium]
MADQKKKIRKKRFKGQSAGEFTLKTTQVGPPVLLESSFILGLLDPRDANHKSVKSVFGFLDPHNCRFHIPAHVFTEVVSKLIQKEKQVSKALKIIDKFLSELHGSLFLGSNPSLEDIMNRYRGLARKRIRFLQSNDFVIATEGIFQKSLILTCDSGMYEKVKKYYPDIYFVATDSRKYKDDIPKFTRRLLAISKKKH